MQKSALMVQFVMETFDEGDQLVQESSRTGPDFGDPGHHRTVQHNDGFLLKKVLVCILLYL